MKALPIQYTRPKILDRLSVVIAYIYHSGQGDIPDVIMNQGSDIHPQGAALLLNFSSFSVVKW